MLHLERPPWFTVLALKRGVLASVLLALVWIGAEALEQALSEVPVLRETDLAFGAVLGLLGLPLVAVEGGARQRGPLVRSGVFLAALLLIPVGVLAASIQASFTSELISSGESAKASQLALQRLAFSAPRMDLELPLALRWGGPLLGVFAARLAGLSLVGQLVSGVAGGLLGLGVHLEVVHHAFDPQYTLGSWTWSEALHGPTYAALVAGLGVPLAWAAAEHVKLHREPEPTRPRVQVRGTRRLTARDRFEQGLAFVHGHLRLATVLFFLVGGWVLAAACDDSPPEPEAPPSLDAADTWLHEALPALTDSARAKECAEQALRNLQNRDLHLAVLHAEWALEADPDYEYAMLLLAAALGGQGRYADVEEICTRMLDRRSSCWAIYTRASARERQGDYEGAEEGYSELIASMPGQRWPYWPRADARRAIEDYAGAALDKAVARQEAPTLDHSPLWLLD